ncbi:MAG: hypothetical protein NTY35_11990 [Planctomycetota bacterium]|nr:hypothetical protein [Planctomycetota bacterium]
MSSVIGSEPERFGLPRAVDALGEAARQAGRPGFVWLAGLFYPSVGIGIGGIWDGPVKLMPGDPGVTIVGLDTSPQLASVLDFLVRAYVPLFALPFIAVLFLPLFRLVAGLAKVGSAEAWQLAAEGRRNPRLRSLWKLGEGLTFATYGLWLQLVLMQILAFVVLLLPIIAATRHLGLATEADRIAVLLGIGVLVGPFILVFGLYMLALSVLGQLGLQSLAENRRGVSSALLHAWRIMRQDPRATARAVVAELVLLVVALIAVRAFAGIVGQFPLSDTLVVFFQLALMGFAGVVRAGYWARAYRALGGLTPADGVPGLAAA